MWKKLRVPIISLVFLFLMLGGVFVWNKIIKKEDKNNTTFVDVSDANNVPSVDKKLGSEDVPITQSYLRNYTIHKTATWYQSSGIVKSIKYNKDEAIIVISDNEGNSIETSISKSSCNVKKKDSVNFVGVVSIKYNHLVLSKISKDEISYNNTTTISIKDLKDNLDKLKMTYFVINGYMVTEGKKFKLYESKESYQKDPSSGNYFVMTWKGEFLYTGNQNVKVRCQLSDTYGLKNCTLIEK